MREPPERTMNVLFAVLSSAFAVDHTALQTVYNTYVTSSGRVDYAGVKGQLDGYLGSLATAAEPSDRNEKMAFWINAYNALTIDMMADSMPVNSITDLDGGKVWDTRKFKVAGKDVTLNNIEHNILRPLGDPRIHAAVNCASIGCPPLNKDAFLGSKLGTQLDAAAKKWATTNGVSIDKTAKTATFNKIFDWYGDDFVKVNKGDVPGIDGKPEAAANFLAGYVAAEDAAFLKAGGWTAGWSSYNWNVNKK